MSNPLNMSKFLVNPASAGFSRKTPSLSVWIYKNTGNAKGKLNIETNEVCLAARDEIAEVKVRTAEIPNEAENSISIK